jgi:hypothetical protein
MIISQIENEIRQLQQEEQLELLSWLADYIRQHSFQTEFGTTASQGEITLDDIEHPLQGTVLKYNEPFEPVALEDWDALQ